MDNVVDSIRPPLPGFAVQEALQQAGEDFKTAICTAVKAHIHCMTNLKTQSLANFGDIDQELVDATARRMVNKQFGPKMCHSTIDQALSNLTNNTDQLRVTAIQPGYNDVQYSTAQAMATLENNKRGHRSEDSTPTAERIARDPHKVQAPPVKRLLLSSTRDDADALDVEQDSEEDTVAALADLNAGAQLNKVTTMQRPFNLLHVPQQADNIFIMDSNGRVHNDLEVPEHYHIFALRGAKINDIAPLLNNHTQSLAHFTTIVVAVGINNRNDPGSTRLCKVCRKSDNGAVCTIRESPGW